MKKSDNGYFFNELAEAGFLFILMLAFLQLIFFSCNSKADSRRISVSDFGAIPDDGHNDAGPLRKAVDHCRQHPGTTLAFEPGIYNFRDEKAVQFQDDVMNGRMGPKSHEVIRKYYSPYVKGLDLNGFRDITIEAAGAVLLCDGWMEPLSMENCINITLKGLTIDYKRKPYSIGSIVNVKEDWFEAEFDTVYPVNPRMPVPRMKFWNLKANRMEPFPVYNPVKFEVIAPQKVRIFKNVNREMEGNLVLIPHSFHSRPAIFIHTSRNIHIEDVTIHSQPGMGILGHRSEDITLIGLRVVPSTGSVQSTNTDATHFTSCKGVLRFENCMFEGQGDDATNVHNFYYAIRKPTGVDGYDLMVPVPISTHAQLLEYPDRGDTLELVERASLAVIGKYVVEKVENHENELFTRVVLNGDIPSDLDQYYLTDCTRIPRVEISGCTITSNLAHGLVIRTRNVLIERCLIRETTMAGIAVRAAGEFWAEGLTPAEITIRYNHIVRCGRNDSDTDHNTCGIVVGNLAPVDTVAVNKNILIEGNIIEGESSGKGIYVSSTEGIIIRFNEISGSEIPVEIRNSKNVRAYANPGVPDLNTAEVK